MNEEIKTLEAALTRANKGLGIPTNVNKGAEATYGDAYQQLVRLGARPQLRKKYRSIS